MYILDGSDPEQGDNAASLDAIDFGKLIPPTSVALNEAQVLVVGWQDFEWLDVEALEFDVYPQHELLARRAWAEVGGGEIQSARGIYANAAEEGFFLLSRMIGKLHFRVFAINFEYNLPDVPDVAHRVILWPDS